MNKNNILFSIIVILITLLSIGLVNAVPTDGVSFYPFDEGSGSTLGDNWGSNDGSITSDDVDIWSGIVPTFADGVTSPDYSLSGNGEDYVDLGFTPDTDDFSIAGWVRFNSVASFQEIFTTVQTSTNRDGVMLTLHDEVGWRMGFYNDNDAFISVTEGSVSSSVDTWYNIVLNYYDNGTAKLWVNNASMISEYSATSLSTHDSNLHLMQDYVTITGDTLDGYESYFQVFSEPLTEEEISNFYKSGRVDVTSYFDIINTNSINNMTAYFNSTSYSTTNGTIVTGIESTEEFNIIMESNQGYYFNNTYTNYNISEDLEVTFYEYPYVSTNINNFTATIDGVDYITTNGLVYVPFNSSKTINITTNQDYFSTSFVHDFSDLTDINKTLVEYPYVNVSNSWTGETIESFNISFIENDYELINSACVYYGGTWLSEYKECESVSSMTITESVCDLMGGTYHEGSSCRNSDPGDYCVSSVVYWCSFEEISEEYSSYVTYLTTNGKIYVPINQSVDLTIRAEGYFNTSFVHDFTDSNDLETELNQSIIRIEITEKYSGNNITNWVLLNGSEVLINTTDNYDIVNLAAGQYNDLTLKSNIASFSDRMIDGFNVSSLDNKTISYDFLPTELSIIAKDFLTNTTINNFSVSINSLNSSHSGTYSITTGELVFGVINNDDYSVIIDAIGYSLFNNTDIININGNTNKTFRLFTENSIFFEVFNEQTGEPITDLIDIVMDGDYKSYSFNITNSTHYIDDIIDGVYSIKASYNDSIKYYSVTVGDRSYSDVNIFFGSNYNNVSFSFLGGNTGNILEDVYFTMSRYINGSLMVVGSGISNILGHVNMPYVEGTYYKFIASKDGYAPKEFTLDPIFEDKYYVRMYVSSEGELISDGVSVNYNHDIFVYGENNFSIIFNSPLGTLTDYSYTLVYPGSNSSDNGINANGEIFDFAFNITNVDIGSYVKLIYNYNTTISDQVTKTIFFPVTINSDDPGLWSGIGSFLGKEGLWTRIILVTIIVIFLSGFAYLIGGSTASLIIGMLIYTFFVIIKVIPLWSILITLLIGFLSIIKLGGD